MLCHGKFSKSDKFTLVVNALSDWPHLGGKSHYFFISKVRHQISIFTVRPELNVHVLSWWIKLIYTFLLQVLDNFLSILILFINEYKIKIGACKVTFKKRLYNNNNYFLLIRISKIRNRYVTIVTRCQTNAIITNSNTFKIKRNG